MPNRTRKRDPNNEQLFYATLWELEANPHVRLMEQYQQHKGNTTLRHCHNVAVCSFHMAQKLGWRIDEKALARGALLHDYHLYTFHETDVGVFHHIANHPRQALQNALGLFRLTEKERNIITSHMWPLTFFQVPKSKEAFLVTLADKYCALCEMTGQQSRLRPVPLALPAAI